MKEPVELVDLLNRNTQFFEEAQLYSGLDEKNLIDFETAWKPAFREKLDGATPEEAGRMNLQDAHWQWRDKFAVRDGQLWSRAFALEADELTQGLMFVDVSKFARLETQDRLHLVYVDFLSTAPWNRRGLAENPKYKGVGRIMIATAVSLSIEEGFRGRVGLHALPQSESWYRDICRMTDLGADASYQNLHYFEMTEEQANEFLNGN